MAAEVVQPLMMPNRRIYEECKQLVTHIRGQLGDPNEFINNFGFEHGHAFGLVETAQVLCHYQTPYYRHAANFALVLRERYFAGEVVSEMRTPIFSFYRCTRLWQVVANFTPGSETIRDEIDIYLECHDVQNDLFIPADIRTDLYRGTEMIGDEMGTNSHFTEIFTRRLIFTGVRRRTLTDDTVDPDGFADAYTLLGSLCFKNCCNDLIPVKVHPQRSTRSD